MCEILGPSTRKMWKHTTIRVVQWSPTLFQTALDLRATWSLSKSRKKSMFAIWNLVLHFFFLQFFLWLFDIPNAQTVSRFPFFGKKYQLKFSGDMSAETHCLVHFPSLLRLIFSLVIFYFLFKSHVWCSVLLSTHLYLRSLSWDTFKQSYAW